MGPYILTCRRWAFRCGPGSAPCSGCGMFLDAYVRCFCITIIPIQRLLDLGIVLADLDSFVKTSTGVSFLQEEATSIYLSAGHVVYVPFGYTAVQTVANGEHSSGANCTACLQPCARTIACLSLARRCSEQSAGRNFGLPQGQG